MATKKKRSNRPRRGSRRGGGNKLYLKIALTALCMIVISGAGYGTYLNLGKVRPDEFGCLPDTDSHTVAWMDYTSAFHEGRHLAVKAIFERIYQALAPTEQWTLITTEKEHYSSLGEERFTLCAPDHGSKNPAYVKRKIKETYDDEVSPVIDEILGDSTTVKQIGNFEKVGIPIIENIQNISLRPDFSPELKRRRLVVISHMIQVSELAEFCFEQGHLPPYERFKTLPKFEAVKPGSLEGVDVSIFMLILSNYGEGALRYCTEQELRDFWTAYFEDAGASSVQFHRIR